MLDSETVIYGPYSDPDHLDDGRTRVVMRTHGCKLVLCFADPGRQGPVLELSVLPDAVELSPQVLREFMPRAPLFLLYARAAMSENREEWRAASRALRDLGSTRRGLTPEFYRLIALNYKALLAEGEPHPVKALAAMHNATISSASRWIKEAKRLELIEEDSDAS